MKRGAWLALTLAALMTAPSLARAQEGPRGEGCMARADRDGPPRGQRGRRGPMAGPGAGERNPVRCLLTWDELELTESQTASLEELARELEDKNEPLVREMRERMPEDPRSLSRAERRELMGSMRPLMEEVRANNRSVLESVTEVLDDGQKDIVQKRMEQRGRWGPRGGRRGGPGGGRGF